MTYTYDIRNYPPLEFKAKCICIRDDGRSPIVFLIDERHHNVCHINENIVIAKNLLAYCNVNLIGVEGYNGGVLYNAALERTNSHHSAHITVHYDRFKITHQRLGEPQQEIPIGNDQQFSNAMIPEGRLVVGVDCEGFSDKALGIDTEDFIQPENRQEYSLRRSRHFIETLFWEYRKEDITGNLILNCGSHHNEHIRNMILQREIEAVAGMRASYYVIRNIYHPDYEKLV